jgi:hypothetical protein
MLSDDELMWRSIEPGFEKFAALSISGGRLKIRQLPVDGRQASRLEGGVGFGKVAAAEESTRGGKRRRVGSFQHRMAASVDPFGLTLGIAAP